MFDQTRKVFCVSHGNDRLRCTNDERHAVRDVGTIANHARRLRNEGHSMNDGVLGFV